MLQDNKHAKHLCIEENIFVPYQIFYVKIRQVYNKRYSTYILRISCWHSLSAQAVYSRGCQGAYMAQFGTYQHRALVQYRVGKSI